MYKQQSMQARISPRSRDFRGRGAAIARSRRSRRPSGSLSAPQRRDAERRRRSANPAAPTASHASELRDAGVRASAHPESDEVNETPGEGPERPPSGEVPLVPLVPGPPVLPAVPPCGEPLPAAPPNPPPPVGPGQFGGGKGQPWLVFHVSSCVFIAAVLSATSVTG